MSAFVVVNLNLLEGGLLDKNIIFINIVVTNCNTLLADNIKERIKLYISNIDDWACACAVPKNIFNKY
jgi:hypothetical protein